MAVIKFEGRERNVAELVNLYGSDRFGDGGGQIERLSEEITNTRAIVARLIYVMVDKRILSEAEVLKIIRGH